MLEGEVDDALGCSGGTVRRPSLYAARLVDVGVRAEEHAVDGRPYIKLPTAETMAAERGSNQE